VQTLLEVIEHALDGLAAGIVGIAAVATAGILAILAVAFGYDPLAAVLATRDAYEHGIGGRRPYLYWVIGAPAAFLIVLGPLLAERLLRGVELGGAAARAVALCVLLSALSGVIEAEGERILQFLTPLAAVAAAPYARSRRWVFVGLALDRVNDNLDLNDLHFRNIVGMNSNTTAINAPQMLRGFDRLPLEL
jgi:hypothetical protein